jgi:hypothetical protein
MAWLAGAAAMVLQAGGALAAERVLVAGVGAEAGELALLARALRPDAVVSFGEVGLDGAGGAALAVVPGEVTSRRVGDVVVVAAGWPAVTARLVEAVGVAEPLVLCVDAAAWRSDADAWRPVHAALAARGAPAMVLAPFDGLVRDDGVRDGVAYRTVGPAPEANLSGRRMDAVGVPASTLVTIDASGTTAALLTERGVKPGDWVLGAEADAAAGLGEGTWAAIEGSLRAGSGGGFVTVMLENPTGSDLSCTVSVHGPAGWTFSPRVVERAVAAGTSAEIRVEALTAPLGEEAPRIEVAARTRLPLANGQEQPIVRLIDVPVWPALGEASAAAEDGAGVFDGRTAAVFPVEAEVVEGVGVRVRGSAPAGSQVVWSTGPAGELALVWSDRSGGEPMPAAVLRVGDVVAVARADTPWRWDAWTDLDVVFADGSLVLLVDGREAGRAAVPAGVRLSDDTLIVGAAPGGMPGLFNAYFRGRIAHVVSGNGHGGDLEVPFDEDVSPAVRDTGTTGAHGWAIGPLRIEAVE